MEEVELAQSRFQNIFNRFYEMTVNIIYTLAFAVVAVMFFSTNFNIGFFITITLTITLFLIAYMWIAYPEPSKKIVLNEEGFTFFNYENKRNVKWSEYQGYKITRFMPHKIQIKILDRKDIVFSYYLFSSSQRKQLFEMLEKHAIK